MTPDTIFEMMSMTKPIVSAALMMLFEEGRFLLDDPIEKWLPEYKNHTVRVNTERADRANTVTEVRPVTVRHVLTHTSGLTLNPRGKGLTQAQVDQVTNGGKGWPTLAEQVANAAVIPAAFHPGDYWQYGDSTNYVAVLVEKISEQSIDVFLRERIFEPLGMTDTYYYVPREKVDRVAAVYRPDTAGRIELRQAPAFREPTRMFRGTAGLSSTAADYYQFAQMIANGGELNGVRLLGRMTVDNMISNHIGVGKDVYIRGGGYGFGLGFGVLTNSAEAQDALSIGSYTWGGAYGTLYWADPVEDLIGILLMQIRPYDHLSIRPLFSNVVTQAVTDSFSDQKPIVMGRPTPH
jgi:CubicO group peptidase (beta-lactamase class C family)